MKPSYLPRVLFPLLAISLALPHPRALSADATGDMATTTLQGLNSALGSVNGFFNAFGSSSAQLQALAAQLSQARNQTNGVQQQQSQFDKIQQQLTLAMTEANNCVQQATPANYDKYFAKRSAKEKEIVKGLSADTITSAEPTCATYGVILDAIEMNKAKMYDANKRMSCLTNLQAKVNQIAEAAKAPFQQLNQAATEVYKTHTQIIDSHKRIADKIASDVDGPADKDGNRKGGGYREELGKLKQMALELNNVLNAKPGENKDGLKYGLVKRVNDLKQQRAAAANQWYFSMMSDVEYCYHSEPAPCFDNDISMPPDQCLGAMIQNEAVGPGGAIKARAKTDMAGLRNVGLKNYMNAQKVNLPANIDVTKPDEFLSFTQNRFSETLNGVLGAYRNHKFAMSIDKSKLTQFVSANYRACYEKSVAKFKSDMISKGGTYYNGIVGMQDAEREVSNDLKNWLDRVEGQMSNFRTQFHKVYNSELAQFKTDCTAEEDPYKALDCLRVLNAQLQSGIRGTGVSTKLGNNTMFRAEAGETVLPIQSLTLDASGKPTIGSSSVTCSGFDDCINYLDRAREQHAGAAQKGEEDRQKFVDQHNAATRASFDIVAQQFGQVSQLLTAAVKGVNDDLVKLGIKATVKTKQIEGEELKEDKKNGGLIGMPKSMKAALAGRNAFTEIDDKDDVTNAFNTMLGDLNKKAGDAQKQKRLCRVSSADYKALNGIMPNCENTAQICSRDRVTQAAGVLEPILRRSKEKVDENDRSRALTSTADYRQCVNEIKADANSELDDDQKLNEFALSHNMPTIFKEGGEKDGEVNARARANARNAMKRANAAQIRKGTREDCSDFILNALGAQAGDGRASLQQQNQDIVQGLRAVTAACAGVEPDSEGKIENSEEVTSACQGFKKAVADAKEPSQEFETGALGGAGTRSSGGDAPNNPFSGTKSAQ